MTKKNKYEFVDYIFWSLLIVYSNPGGFLHALGLASKEGSTSVSDLIFFLIFGTYLLVSYKHKIRNNNYKKILIYLGLFSLYYLLVFGFYTPIDKDTAEYSFFLFIKKSRTTIYSFLFFVMVYYFYLRSNIIFFRMLIVSSILILSIFIIMLVTGIEILPIERSTRNFASTDRIFLRSYGFMPLLIPIGAITIVFFKKKFHWKKIILLAFSLMFMAWLLSITRRHIIGSFIYLILAIILFNYFQRKALISLEKFFSVFVYVIVIGSIIFFSFPKYMNSGIAAVENVVAIFNSNESSSKTQDVRLGFGKDFMQKKIINNPILGTGFDNRWRTKEGDEQGYEASDYPFLGAIAMTGVFGILCFLPIYIILIKSLIFDVKYLKRNKIKFHSIEFFGLMLFILYFVYDIFQYMNWFSPVSLAGRSSWYIFLAMYFASRQIFYSSPNNIKNYAV